MRFSFPLYVSIALLCGSARLQTIAALQNGPTFADTSCDSDHVLVEINQTKKEENRIRYFWVVLDDTTSEVITTCNTEGNYTSWCGNYYYSSDDGETKLDEPFSEKPTRFCLPRNSCFRFLYVYDDNEGPFSIRASYDREVFFHTDEQQFGGWGLWPESIVFGDSCETQKSTLVVELFHQQVNRFDNKVEIDSHHLPYQIFHVQDSSNCSIQEKATTMPRLNYFQEYDGYFLYYSKFEIPKDSCMKFDSFPCANNTAITRSIFVVDGIFFGQRSTMRDCQPIGEFGTVFAGACSKHPVCGKEQAVVEIGLSKKDEKIWDESSPSWNIRFVDADNRFRSEIDRWSKSWTKYTQFVCIPRLDSCVLLYVNGDQSEFDYYAKIDDSLVDESPGCVQTKGSECSGGRSMTRLVDSDCPLLPQEERRRLASLYGGITLGILSPFLMIIAWQGLKKYCNSQRS